MLLFSHFFAIAKFVYLCGEEKQCRVIPFVDIHTHLALAEGTVGLISHRLGIEPTAGLGAACSVGIHPWDVDRIEQVALQLEKLHTLPARAIGEAGLDRACDADFVRQKEIFERQVVIASERNLPLIIHCVSAQSEILAILRHYPNLKAAIFHGFIGSPDQASELTSRGYFLSFGFGALRSPKTVNALRACPSSALFLESDTTEDDISTLYEQVAEVRKVDIATLKREIYDNYIRIFG